MSPRRRSETPGMLPPLAGEPLIPRGVWALLAALPVFLVVFASDFRSALTDSFHPDFRANVEVALLAEDAPTTPTMRLTGEWRPGPRGGLDPATPVDPETSERPGVEIEVPAGVWDAAEIEVIGAPGSTWSVRMTRAASAPDGTRELVSATPALAQESERVLHVPMEGIPAPGAVNQPIRLRIELREPGRADGERFDQLRRVRVRFTSETLNRIPYVPDYIGLALFPFLAGIVLRLGFGFSGQRCVAGGVGFGFLVFVLAGMQADQGDRGLAWGLATGAAAAGWLNGVFGAYALRRHRRLPQGIPVVHWQRAGAAMALLLVVLLGVFTRWDAYETERRTELGWDADGYVEIARTMQSPFATEQSFPPWVREPFFPWLLRGWFTVAPESDASARFFGLMLSLGMLAAVFAVGRRLFGEFVAFLAAAMLALSSAWAQMAVQVLRLDLLVLLLMALLACRVLLEAPAGKRAALWAAAGVALVLTRLSQLALVVPVLAWEVWKRRWRPWEIALALGAAILLVVPHLAFNARHDRSGGDPFFSSNVHTLYYHNRAHIGEPGFPATRVEFDANPYVGEPMSAMRWMVGEIGVPRAAWLHVVGFWRLFAEGPRLHVFGGSALLMIPGLLGAWALWNRRERWWVAGWFALAALPAALVAGLGTSWRIGAEAHVLALWLWALGIAEAIRLLFTAARRRWPAFEVLGRRLSAAQPDPSAD